MGEDVDLLRQRVDQLGLLIQNVQQEAHANRDNLAAAVLAGPALGTEKGAHSKKEFQKNPLELLGLVAHQKSRNC